jgi:hypothetical protein
MLRSQKSAAIERNRQVELKSSVLRDVLTSQSDAARLHGGAKSLEVS